MSRTNVLVSSGMGLIVCLVGTTLALLARPWLPPWPAWLNLPLMAWGIFLFLIAFALLEIPVMVYGLRKIAAGNSPRSPTITLVGNGIYVAFPLIYALPNLLLTNASLIWLGIVISATSFLRFASSIIFLPSVQILKPRPEEK